MGRLPHDSLTRALASGGSQYFGWDPDRYMLADLIDAINNNTLATGNWKKGQVPKFQPYPRPEETATDGSGKKRRSVKDIYRHFSGR